MLRVQANIRFMFIWKVFSFGIHKRECLNLIHLQKLRKRFSFQSSNRNIAGTRFKFDFPFACRRVGPLWATSENIRVTIWGWPDGIFSSGWKAIIVQTYHMLRPLSLGLDTIMAITIQTPDSRCEYSKHATRLFCSDMGCSRIQYWSWAFNWNTNLSYLNVLNS